MPCEFQNGPWKWQDDPREFRMPLWPLDKIINSVRNTVFTAELRIIENDDCGWSGLMEERERQTQCTLNVCPDCFGGGKNPVVKRLKANMEAGYINFNDTRTIFSGQLILGHIISTGGFWSWWPSIIEFFFTAFLLLIEELSADGASSNFWSVSSMEDWESLTADSLASSGSTTTSYSPRTSSETVAIPFQIATSCKGR